MTFVIVIRGHELVQGATVALAFLQLQESLINRQNSYCYCWYIEDGMITDKKLQGNVTIVGGAETHTTSAKSCIVGLWRQTYCREIPTLHEGQRHKLLHENLTIVEVVIYSTRELKLISHTVEYIKAVTLFSSLTTLNIYLQSFNSRETV